MAGWEGGAMLLLGCFGLLLGIAGFWSLTSRFTKLGKLVLERNSIKAPMEGDNSACDL